MTIPDSAVENYSIAVENRVSIGPSVVNRHIDKPMTEFRANEPIYLIVLNFPESRQMAHDFGLATQIGRRDDILAEFFKSAFRVGSPRSDQLVSASPIRSIWAAGLARSEV
jgi:hypothetical protein